MKNRLLCAVILWAGSFGIAQAELRICNDTRVTQSVSLGFKGETDWTSKGWWNIEPDKCATVVAGDLTKRYYYYHADSVNDDFRGQNFSFCTRDKKFEIVGDIECDERGYTATSFREIDTGETATAFTLTLVASSGSAGGNAKAPGGGGESGEIGTQTVTEAPEETVIDVDVAALETDLPSGRHGEPFKVMAAFQGCELDNGRAYCSFHADGVKLRAFYNGPTPEDLMFALEEMSPAMWAEIEGDAAEMEGHERAVVFRAVRPMPTRDPHRRLRFSLQGHWFGAEDPDQEITIRGSEIYVRYQGAFKAARFLQIADRCDGMREDGPVLLQTARGEMAPKCYKIAQPSQTLLELRPVAGGEVLRFRKQ